MDTSLTQLTKDLRRSALEMLAKCDQLDALTTGRKLAVNASPTASAPKADGQRKRELSQDARNRISKAQKKRWREEKKRKALEAKVDAKKPQVKVAGR